MSRIFDNIETKFTDGLKGILTNTGVKRADFCVGYFNLRGWGIISREIDSLPGDCVYEKEQPVFRRCRLLIGMQRPEKETLRQVYSCFERSQTPDSDQVRQCLREMAREFRQQLTFGVPDADAELALRALYRQLVEKKVSVKLHLRHPLHAKLYLAHRPGDKTNPVMSLMGSSNLTYSGLTKQGELDAEFGDYHDGEKFAKWFDDRWDDRFSIDISEELAKVIDESWASEHGPTPHEIYLKIIYHLSREARSGIKEFVIPPKLERELFDFQANAVKIIARKLEKHHGAMIGDVVGLGKTFTACAVAAAYEMRYGGSTLILCPANLQEMWHQYVRQYDLKAEVRSISRKIDVEKERFYRLVIVDESHNLRNSEGSRYRNIYSLIEYQGPDVLLLTATPYNKNFSDLANQLRLFVSPDQDLGIQPERYIRELRGAREFAKRHNEIHIRSVKAFEKSPFADDWRDLMRLYLVRRTRTFIRENYAKVDPADNRRYLEYNDGSRSYFPDRLPRALKFTTAPDSMFERLHCDRMVDLMCEIKLPRYGLKRYLNHEASGAASKHEAQLLDNLSRAGVRLMGFCRSGFYKRMDSSGIAFLISLYRHAVRNAVYIHALENGLDLPIGDEGGLDDGYTEDEDEGGTLRFEFPLDIADYLQAGDDHYNWLHTERRKHVNWLSSRFFTPALKEALLADTTTIIAMLCHAGSWHPDKDEKLAMLESLVREKHPHDKILVFSQYADTIHYLHGQLAGRGIERVAAVTGNSENISATVTRFSPASNKAPLPIPENEQYRVLLATDVLSEGQNLQDAHIVVNYDMPWAIIRLIQRAGRVDRIGQQSPHVYCYSFFPASGIEKILRLRERLERRIAENAETVGSDELFFEGNARNLTDIFNEKSHALDDDEGEVDLTSFAFEIWQNAIAADPALKTRIPALADVSYSTKPCAADAPEESVVTYARTMADNDILSWTNLRREVVSQSPFAILKALACTADTPALPPLPQHHELVAAALCDIDSQKLSSQGVLGPRFSTKNRLYTMLDGYLSDNSGTIFATGELKRALDDIYNLPLQENAKLLLGQLIKRGTPAQQVAETVIDLRRDGELCIMPDENAPAGQEPQIICSMGIRQAEQASGSNGSSGSIPSNPSSPLDPLAPLDPKRRKT